jgi:hypothetical protein
MAWWRVAERPKDDRGGAVDVARAELALRLGGAGDDADPELREIMRRQAGLPRLREMNRQMDRARIIRFSAATAGIVVIIVLMHDFRVPPYAMSLAVSACMIAALLVARRLLREKHFGRRIELYSYYGRCPQCLSSLRGLTTAEDGCVACPECSCAWRASRIAPASVLDGLVRIDEPPTREKLTPNHRDGRGWTWPPRPVRDTVLDAFARPVLLAPADLSNLSTEEREAIPVEVRKEIERSAGGFRDRVIAVGLRIGLGAFFVFPSVMAINFFAMGPRWRIDAIIPFVSALGGVLFLGFVLVRLPRYFRRATVTRVDRFLQAMLRADRCPSCAGSIADVDYAEHGVRRCPRCGAEWAPAGRVVARESGVSSRAR